MTRREIATDTFRLHSHESWHRMTEKHTVRRASEIVFAVLRGPDASALERELVKINTRDWQHSYHWLDASGLALYFLNVLKLSHLDDSLPNEVLSRLEQNARDNKARLIDQFEEFRKVNDCLTASRVPYVNVKGFTLSPEYCPDLSLRYQCDLDIMIRRADAHKCRSVLEELGYKLTVEDPDTLEFKAGEDRFPKISELYKPRSQRALEVHFASPLTKADVSEDCIERAALNEWNGFSFPDFRPVDKFLAQVFHVYRHLLSEWVRLSWFYELENFLRSHAGDTALWREVSDRAAADRNTAGALGLIAAFSQEAFSGEIPPELDEIATSNLRASARLWIKEYGRSVLLSDFPGTKLYLLLLRELSSDQQSWNQLSRKRLLPLHVPPHVLWPDMSRSSFRQFAARTRYALRRGRFHLREGARYLAEQRRWNLRVRQAGLVG